MEHNLTNTILHPIPVEYNPTPHTTTHNPIIPLTSVLLIISILSLIKYLLSSTSTTSILKHKQKLIDDLSKQKQILSTSLSQADSQLQSQNKKHANLIDQLNKKHRAEQKKVQDEQQKVTEDYEKQLSALQREHQSTKAENKELKAQIISLQEERENKKHEENKQKQLQKQKDKEEKEAKQREDKQREAEKHAFIARLADKDTQLQSSIFEVKRLTDNLSLMENNVDRYRTEAKEARADDQKWTEMSVVVEQLRQHNAALQQELEKEKVEGEMRKQTSTPLHQHKHSQSISMNNNELPALRSQLHDQNELISVLQTSVSRLTETNEQLQQTINQLSESKARLQQQYDERQAELATQQFLISNLQQSLDTRHNELLEVEGKLKDLNVVQQQQAGLANASGPDIKPLFAKQEALAHSLGEALPTTTSISGQDEGYVIPSNDQTEQLNAVNRALQAQMNERQEKIEQLNVENAELIEFNERFSAETQQLTQQKIELTNQCTQMQQIITELTRRKEELEQELFKVLQRLGWLEQASRDHLSVIESAHKAELSLQREAHEQARGTLNARMTAVENDCAKLSAQSREYESTISSLRASNTRLDNDNDQLRQIVNQRDADLLSLRAKAEAQEVELCALRQLFTETERSVSHDDAEPPISANDDQLNESITRIEEQLKYNTRRENSLEISPGTGFSSPHSHRILPSSTSNSATSAAGLQQIIADLQQELSASKGALSAAQHQMESQQATIDRFNHHAKADRDHQASSITILQNEQSRRKEFNARLTKRVNDLHQRTQSGLINKDHEHHTTQSTEIIAADVASLMAQLAAEHKTVLEQAEEVVTLRKQSHVEFEFRASLISQLEGSEKKRQKLQQKFDRAQHKWEMDKAKISHLLAESAAALASESESAADQESTIREQEQTITALKRQIADLNQQLDRWAIAVHEEEQQPHEHQHGDDSHGPDQSSKPSALSSDISLHDNKTDSSPPEIANDGNLSVRSNTSTTSTASKISVRREYLKRKWHELTYGGHRQCSTCNHNNSHGDSSNASKTPIAPHSPLTPAAAATRRSKSPSSLQLKAPSTVIRARSPTLQSRTQPHTRQTSQSTSASLSVQAKTPPASTGAEIQGLEHFTDTQNGDQSSYIQDWRETLKEAMVAASHDPSQVQTLQRLSTQIQEITVIAETQQKRLISLQQYRSNRDRSASEQLSAASTSSTQFNQQLQQIGDELNAQVDQLLIVKQAEQEALIQSEHQIAENHRLSLQLRNEQRLVEQLRGEVQHLEQEIDHRYKKECDYQTVLRQAALHLPLAHSRKPSSITSLQSVASTASSASGGSQEQKDAQQDSDILFIDVDQQQHHLITENRDLQQRYFIAVKDIEWLTRQHQQDQEILHKHVKALHECREQICTDYADMLTLRQQLDEKQKMIDQLTGELETRDMQCRHLREQLMQQQESMQRDMNVSDSQATPPLSFSTIIDQVDRHAEREKELIAQVTAATLNQQRLQSTIQSLEHECKEMRRLIGAQESQIQRMKLIESQKQKQLSSLQSAADSQTEKQGQTLMEFAELSKHYRAMRTELQKQQHLESVNELVTPPLSPYRRATSTPGSKGSSGEITPIHNRQSSAASASSMTSPTYLNAKVQLGMQELAWWQKYRRRKKEELSRRGTSREWNNSAESIKSSLSPAITPRSHHQSVDLPVSPSSAASIGNREEQTTSTTHISHPTHTNTTNPEQ